MGDEMKEERDQMQRKKVHRRKKGKENLIKAITIFWRLFFAVFFLFPFVWMLSVSLQTETEFMTTTGFLEQIVPKSWRFENYADVFRTVPFARYFMNSGIVALLTVGGTLVSASLVAYAFSKLRWPGRNFFYSLMLVTMILPSFILMIPTYKMYSAFGMTNSWLPLILPSFLGGGAGNIILIQQFYQGVPGDIIEAARIDGAGEAGIWWKIMLPLSKPVLATVAVFAFLFSWNDYLGPLLYVNDQRLTTVALGLRAFQSQSSTNWPLLMAGSVISVVPNLIIFTFGQKYFLEGTKAGAVKG